MKTLACFLNPWRIIGQGMGLHIDYEYTQGFQITGLTKAVPFSLKIKVRTCKPRKNIVLLLGNLGLNSKHHSRYLFARSYLLSFVLLLPDIDCEEILAQLSY